MRRAKRITALAVAAAMVFSNVAYAAPGTDTTTTQAGAESAESLNSQSDASGGIEGQASDQTGNGTDSSAQAEQQTETKKTDTQNTTTDAGSQTEAQTTQEETAKEETTKDETSSQTPSTDTQTQETPSTEAEAQKAEEKQEASKTEEEKVLYDITFETPEKHGKVTDMDGNEVADGKTLKTDENGKVQFKVKADDGYQVSAVYQMPDEKTPLKLMKDSYYELQVDENTTVKVVYQKIPEANEDGEDADSKAEEPKEDAGEQESQTNGSAESADKDENQKVDEVEETEQGFEVSFSSKDSHGSVYDLEGNAVEEGSSLKTDQSGKVSFQIKPEDGYQVESVSAGDSQISSDQDGIYNLIVEDNTEVSITYSAVAEKNELSAKAEDYQILYVGDTVKVTCNSEEWLHRHDWKSSNSDAVRVTTTSGWIGGQSGTQTVTAKKVTETPVAITCGDEVIATYIVQAASINVFN